MAVCRMPHTLFKAEHEGGPCQLWSPDADEATPARILISYRCEVRRLWACLGGGANGGLALAAKPYRMLGANGGGKWWGQRRWRKRRRWQRQPTKMRNQRRVSLASVARTRCRLTDRVTDQLMDRVIDRVIDRLLTCLIDSLING